MKNHKEKMQQFRRVVRLYLATFGIGDLRCYGRDIGVARPTAKKKEDLIEEIIAVLTGQIAPIPISKQGAPVKSDRVDERIPARIEDLKREFFANSIIMDLDDEDEFQTIEKKGDKGILFACHAPEKNDPESMYEPLTKKRVTAEHVEKYGQIHFNDGEYRLYTVNGKEDGGIVIPVELVQKANLREGDLISCTARIPSEGDASIFKIHTINGVEAEEGTVRTTFDEEPVRSSMERIYLFDERKHNGVGLKFIEWLMPVAKGQRGCIVSAPKAGKSKLLIQVAKAAHALNSDLEVFALLVEQSMEEIAEMQAVLPKENVFYTTYDDDAERQVFVADFLLNRIKRKVENGEDILLVVDSLSALARAYNDTDASSGGKTLACGLEIKTTRYIKKYFGAARCLEKGGSLTILGAVSTETGNPFDDVVCSEFTSLCNYELRFNTQLAMRRIYPALDLSLATAKQCDGFKSKREEETDFLLRNNVSSKIGAEGLLQTLSTSESYVDFLELLKK